MPALRLLLIDDNPTFLRIAARFLEESEGLSVVGAFTGSVEALARLGELAPDVALVDLAMPEESGLDAIPRLRAARPDMGIVVLTMQDADGYRQAALAAGADEFVPKSQLAQALLPAIRRAGPGAPPAGRREAPR